MLQLSPDVERVRQLIAKRLMEPKLLEVGQRYLDHMTASQSVYALYVEAIGVAGG